MHLPKRPGMLLALLFLCLAGPASAEDALLRADFDAGTAPRTVGGDPNPPAGPAAPPTTVEGISGQAVEISPPERSLAYRAPGNIDLNQGTLLFWLRPVDWDRDADGFVPLLTVGTAKGYGIHYFLYYHHFPGGDRNLDFRARHAGKEYCMTDRETVPANPKVLARGEWTHFALVWNGNQFMLFVNGEKTGEQTYGLPITRAAPAPADGIWFMPNPFWGEQPRPRRVTRLDQVEILGRPLTPDEVRARYRRLRSPLAGAHRPAAATVPRGKTPVILDGRVGAAEWADASRVPVMKKIDGGRIASLPAWCSLKYDDQALYAAFEVDAPHDLRCAGSARGPALFAGDEAEVILRPPGCPADAFGTEQDRYFQFAVNPAGAFACRRAQGTGVHPKDWAWKSGFRCAASRAAGRWSAEMRIPFADLGATPEAGKAWLAQLGLHPPLAQRLGGDYERWLAWSATRVTGRSMFHDPANMGRLLFRPDGLAVRLVGLGDLNAGRCALALKASAPAGLRAVAEVAGDSGKARTWPWAPADGPAPGGLALPGAGEGMLSLRVAGAGSEEPLFDYNAGFYVMDCPVVQWLCHAESGELAVRVDVSGSQDETLRRSLRAGKVRVDALLVARKGGKVVARTAFVPAKADSWCRMRLGALPVGLYDLRVTVAGGRLPLRKTLPFERPDPAFLLRRAGVDRSIPAPWVPIQVAGDRVALLGRTYRFAGGPFPADAASEGQPVLARPVTLFAERGGRLLAFPPAAERVVEAQPDRVVVEGTSVLPDGSLRLRWRRTVAYDGVVSATLTLLPARAGEKVDLDYLRLEAAVPLAAARFVFPYDPAWEQEGKVVARDDMAWLVNHRVGLCWFSDSAANWVVPEGTRPVQILRRGEEALIQARLIGKPVVIGRPVTYVMGFVATPTKSLRADWRRIHAEGWRAPKGETLQSVCWMNSEGIQFFNRWLLGDLVDEDRGRRELAEYKALGIACVPYACGSAMPTNNPIYDFYESQWEITHEGRPAPKDYRTAWRGREFYIGSACPASGFADFMADATQRYMRKYPFAGLYLDYGNPSACDSPRHGCGVVDAFGQKRGSYGVLAKRAMFERLYKIIHAVRPDGYLWTHNWLQFCPPVHSFTDLDFPGEEFMHTAPGNPNVYTDAVPPERWQCDYNSHIRGVGIQFLSEVANTLEEMRDDARRSRPMLTCLLLHDVPCNGNRVHWETIGRVWAALDRNETTRAAFTGYWEPDARVRCSDAGVRASHYTWPGEKRALVVVGNLTAQSRQTMLDLTGLVPAGAVVSATDEESGKPLDLRQPIALSDRDFRLLRLAW